MNPANRTAPTPRRSWLVLASALGLFAPGDARPDEPPGVVRLFDGKSLDGWKPVASYKAGPVEIADGAIALREGGPMTAVVCTRADLPKSNYELTFEARRTGGNDFFAAATFPVGPSFLTLVNGGWGGSVTGLSSLNGADASENETNRFIKYQNGTWYRFRLRVTGVAVRCQLDGKEIFAVRYEGLQVKTRVEVRGCQPLGFASWRSGGEVRGVEVRALTPAEVEEVDRVE